MKLKYTFETMKLDEYIVAVPVGDDAEKFHGVIKLNESAAEIFDLLKEDTTEDVIIDELKNRYGDDQKIPGFVKEVIDHLSVEGVLLQNADN
jgi:uncharacterized protein YihD (DUF1040 family)